MRVDSGVQQRPAAVSVHQGHQEGRRWTAARSAAALPAASAAATAPHHDRPRRQTSANCHFDVRIRARPPLRAPAIVSARRNNRFNDQLCAQQ